MKKQTEHKQNSVKKRLERNSKKVSQSTSVGNQIKAHRQPASEKKSAVRHYTKQLIIPRKENGYRPHLVRRIGLAMTLVLVLVIQCVGNTIQTGSVLGVTDIDRAALLIDTNQERLKYGVATLKESEQLNRAAKMKVDDMFTHQYWSHDSESGVTPWHWFEEADYHYTAAGENLARDFRSAGGVIEAWMDSEEHRANILDSRYRDVGFAVKSGTLQGKNTTIIVALYGSLTSESLSTISGRDRGAVLAARDSSLSLMARLGVGMQSMTPAAIASLFIIMASALVAFIAHAYGRKLPGTVRRTWYRHHGVIKGGGMIVLAITMIFAYGVGGSI